MPHPLRSVTVHITQNCELRCTYCYAGEKTSHTMSSETAHTMIAFLREQNQGNPCRIIFFGGEPLLAFDRIVEITDHIARDEDLFRWSLTTSGTILTDEMINWIKRHDVHVQVSLDGCEEMHNQNRCFVDGSQSFSAVWNSCQMLIKNSIPFITSGVVSPDTVGFLVKGADDLFRGGITRINFSHDTRPIWNHQTISESVKFFSDLCDYYFERIISGLECSISSIDGRVKRALAHAQGLKPRLCSMGMCEISVDCDGSIFPCVQFVSPDSAFKMGSVQGGFDTVRQREVIGLNRSEPTNCLSCDLQKRCLHQCGCVNFKTTGTIDHVSPEFCQFEKEFAPYIDHFTERLWEYSESMFRKKYGL